MDRKFSNPYMNEQEDNNIIDAAAQEGTAESPPSASSTLYNNIGGPTSSKRRRGIQKRVVQIPIFKETEGSSSRLKGESNTPPSDSWAWRKYGQKPIKGSPYPRGYYRCSSSKGCPARKQVERSRVDPTMLVVTYSCEHNHPWPVSRNNHHHHHSSAATRSSKKPQPELVAEPEPEPESEDKFADIGGEDSMIGTADDELGWFGQMAATTSSSAVLGSAIFSGYDADVASVLLPMGEEEESLFADLGELPECSVVFRRGMMETAEGRRRYSAPWCGTTS